MLFGQLPRCKGEERDRIDDVVFIQGTENFNGEPGVVLWKDAGQEQCFAYEGEHCPFAVLCQKNDAAGVRKFLYRAFLIEEANTVHDVASDVLWVHFFVIWLYSLKLVVMMFPE